jgi:hypothetical protein
VKNVGEPHAGEAHARIDGAGRNRAPLGYATPIPGALPPTRPIPFTMAAEIERGMSADPDSMRQQAWIVRLNTRSVLSGAAVRLLGSRARCGSPCPVYLELPCSAT